MSLPSWQIHREKYVVAFDSEGNGTRFRTISDQRHLHATLELRSTDIHKGCTANVSATITVASAKHTIIVEGQRLVDDVEIVQVKLDLEIGQTKVELIVHRYEMMKVSGRP